jgi:hypothetical protein
MGPGAIEMGSSLEGSLSREGPSNVSRAAAANPRNDPKVCDTAVGS